MAARGDALLSPSVTRAVIAKFTGEAARPAPPNPLVAQLTDRERDVVRLVAAGLSNAEIAERLVVSPLTAKANGTRYLVDSRRRDPSSAKPEKTMKPMLSIARSRTDTLDK